MFVKLPPNTGSLHCARQIRNLKQNNPTKKITMEANEIYKLKADAHVKHLISKLNETEAEALEGVAEAESKINLLKTEIDSCKTKKEKLKQKYETLKNADAVNWEKAREDFIHSIEALEDKSVFRTKTEEWFKNIGNVANDLKGTVKDKVSQWM